jgi:hypothetical protein
MFAQSDAQVFAPPGARLGRHAGFVREPTVRRRRRLGVGATLLPPRLIY